MAAAFAVTRSYYKYLADSGGEYRVRLADYIATQGAPDASKIGAASADGTEPKAGSGHALRRVTMRDLANKFDREVVIPDPDALMIELPLDGVSQTLNLNRGILSFTYHYQGLLLTETRFRR